MANEGNLKAHEQTYSGFTALMKWGTAAAFIVGLIVVFIISR
ncbi:aa3-type cytochrome c oxidase subunit IV [Sphingomonas tabacisoli]|uniref:Aa3-type cytochrome c oxidase subunit IV n=1 Tax=Sphingomonas tabacisoli TaxID=2249466 RepID=A0ABW4I2P9_9SPHN